MGTVTSFKDLIVWQKSMTLVMDIYNLTKAFPADEKFGLTSQLRRCAISIPSNIAEGWGRNSTKSYMHFLRIANGSLSELETQLIIAKELNHITDMQKADGLIIEVSKMLNSIIRTLSERG